jgi:hypothetical protein
MNKGQIEAFGLVIIVILIVFVGLIFLVLSRGASEERNMYLSAKAYNLANAIYRANIGEERFRNVARSCCLGRERECDILKGFVRGNLDLVDESAGFVMKCFNGEEIKIGDCFLGITSERFRSENDYEMYVVICER